MSPNIELDSCLSVSIFGSYHCRPLFIHPQNCLLFDFFILSLKLGVFGAAFATILSQGISGVLCLFVIHRKYDVLHLRQEDRVLDRGMVGTLMNMGVPMGLQFSITAIGSMVMQSANNSLGTVYVAGYAAGHKINTLMMCPFDALSAALCTYLSQNYGGLKAERISQGMKAGVKLAVGQRPAVDGIVAGVVALDKAVEAAGLCGCRAVD